MERETAAGPVVCTSRLARGPGAMARLSPCRGLGDTGTQGRRALLAPLAHWGCSRAVVALLRASLPWDVKAGTSQWGSNQPGHWGHLSELSRTLPFL